MDDALFAQIPEAPDAYRGHTVLVRLIDALGFRFRWAVHDLHPHDFEFSAGQGSMTIGELIDHIGDLVDMVRHALEVNPSDMLHDTHVAAAGRILSNLWRVRRAVASLNDEQFSSYRIRQHSFWHAINGPLADALTHVGQINLLRRLNGNPCPPVSVFRGRAD